MNNRNLTFLGLVSLLILGIIIGKSLNRKELPIEPDKTTIVHVSLIDKKPKFHFNDEVSFKLSAAMDLEQGFYKDEECSGIVKDYVYDKVSNLKYYVVGDLGCGNSTFIFTKTTPVILLETDMKLNK